MRWALNPPHKKNKGDNMNSLLSITRLFLDFLLGVIETVEKDQPPRQEIKKLADEKELEKHEELVKEKQKDPTVKIEDLTKVIDQKAVIESNKKKVIQKGDKKFLTFLEMKYAESEKALLKRNVSKYFTLEEVLRYNNGKNTIPISYLTNKEDTFNRVLKQAKALDTIREKYGKPIIVSSWLRTPEWNKKVGGEVNSRHLFGDATDFVVIGVSPKKVYSDLSPSWVGGVGSYKTFTHVDTRGTVARWVG
jgi:hypothetical protein